MPSHQKNRITVLLILMTFLLFGCDQLTQSPSKQGKNNEARPRDLRDVAAPDPSASPLQKRGGDGYRAYVPCYSHIRVAEGLTYNLAINLSIRNTSTDETMVVTLVDFYDSTGTLVKHHADEKIELKPLETVDFFVSERDPSGGFGPNFIVEWNKSPTLSTPVIEAVMIGTGGGQGISFVSKGEILAD